MFLRRFLLLLLLCLPIVSLGYNETYDECLTYAKNMYTIATIRDAGISKADLITKLQDTTKDKNVIKRLTHLVDKVYASKESPEEIFHDEYEQCVAPKVRI